MAQNRIALLALVLATACATASPKPGAPAAPTVAAAEGAPPLALKPAEEARPTLNLVVSAASPEALAANLDALSSQLQLPMKLGEMALGQLTTGALGGVPLTREQLGRLDPGQSLAIAILGSGPCAALTFKDTDLAWKTLQELGPESQRLEGASARKTASGVEIWAGLSDRTLLAAPSRDALLAAGALALEAQRAPRDGQVAVTIYPQNIAQAKGVPLATLVELAAAGMTAELQKKAPAKGKAAPKGKASKKTAKGAPPEITPAMGNMLVGFFKVMAQPIVESQTVQLSLKLNPTDGFLLRTEVVPLPGSPSAGRTKVLPYAIDPKLAVPDDRTTVMAFGEAGTGINSMLAAMASTGPKGKLMGKAMNTVMNEIAGGGSCSMPAGAPITMLCAFQLRPGVTPDRALRAYADMTKGMQAWNDELLGAKKSQVKLKRSKDLLEVEVKMVQADAQTRAMQKLMWGGDVQKYVLAVRDGRIIQAMGTKPREILESWGKASGTGSAPMLATAAARTKGADVLVFFDPVAFFGAIAKSGDDPKVKQVGVMMNAVPGLADLKAPMVIALWGGKTTALDIQLPFQTLANVAQVVRPFMGMMGAPAGPPPPGQGTSAKQ